MRLLVCLLCVVFAVQFVSASRVRELSAGEMRSIIDGQTNENWFIRFYGTKCPYSEAVEGTWDQLADQAMEEELDFLVGAYNVHKDQLFAREIRQSLPLKLPGLHLFPVDEPKKYYAYPSPRGLLVVDDLLDFALVGYEESPGYYRQPGGEFEGLQGTQAIPNGEYDSFLVGVKGRPLAVLVYPPKCDEQCRTLVDLWNRFGLEQKGKRGIHVAHLSGIDNLTIVDRFGARPWPSIVYVQKDRYYRMSQEDIEKVQSVDDLAQWATSGYKSVGKEYSGVDSKHLEYIESLTTDLGE